MKKVVDVIKPKTIETKRRLVHVSVFALVVVSLIGSLFVFLPGEEGVEAAAGDIIVFYDGAVVPDGWSCLSCNSSQPFFNVFPRGSSTYGAASTSADSHNHTAAFDSHTTSSAVQGTNNAGTDFAAETHTHTVSGLSVSSTDHRPPFKNLKLISANTSTLPAGAIAMFDVASTSLPVNWSYYSDMEGNYLRGESATTTGGAADHRHTINASADASTGLSGKNQGGGNQQGVAADGHTHNISGSSTAASNTPPYVEVTFGKLSVESSIPVGMIALFDAAPPTNWTSLSGAGGDFNGRFIRGADSYGFSSGTATHVHGTSTVVGDNNVGSAQTRSGTANFPAADPHTHDFTFNNFSTQSSLPTYRDVVVGQFDGSPSLEQIHYHWRNDDGDESSATSATGGNEDTGIREVEKDSIVRLRYEVSNEGSGTSTVTQYRIEFATSTGGPWTAVPTVGGEPWVMASTSQLLDASNTSNIATSTGGTTDENLNFVVGQQKESGNQAAGITLGASEFTELEYALSPTSLAQNSQVYYFRVTDAGATSSLTYTRTASATIAGIITVASSGSQTATTSIPSNNVYMGGAFTFIRDSGNATVTEMIITASGTVSATNSLSNADIYYEESGTCTFDGGETLFGSAASFTASGTQEIATVSGEMNVSTNQVCVYVELDIDATASDGETVEISIQNPTNEITATRGDVEPSATLDIAGTTTLQQQQGITVGSNGSQVASTTVPSTDFYVGGAFTFVRNTGNATVTQVVITASGTVSAASSLTDINLYYEESGTCNFSGSEAVFGSSTSFTASGTREVATITGNMNVSTNQVCMYAVFDVGSGASDDETIEISIFDPSTEVVVSQGDVSPSSEVGISGTTTLDGPALKVGSIGSQTATTSIPSTDFYTGGAFTFRRNVGTTTVNSITVHATGTIDSNLDLSNIEIYYETTDTCSFQGSEALFGSSTSFNTSHKTTVSGSLSVATSQICIYMVVDVGSGANDGDTIEWQIEDPSTEVSVSTDEVEPTTAVEISGTTTLNLLPTTLTQLNFRFYNNQDDVQPGSALTGENASATDIASGEHFRLRINISVADAKLATSSQAFRLQYAEKGGFGSCASVPGGNYDYVGDVGSNKIWRAYNFGPTANDGDTISSVLLSGSTAPETYQESSSTPANPTAIEVGGAGEWDWALQNNAALSGTNYCFRMVKTGGSSLDSYSTVAELRTREPATWRAAENNATSTDKNSNIRLRVEVSNEGTVSSTVQFAIEYATSTGGPWTNIPFDAACASTATHFRLCLSNNFVDGDPTTNQLTAEEPSFATGTMIESSTPAAAHIIEVDYFTEYEWNIQATDSATDGDTYYFRVTDNGTALDAYSVYPELNIAGGAPTLTQNFYRFYDDNDQITPTDPWPPGGSDLGENTAITATDDPPGLGDVVRIRMSVQVSTFNMQANSQRFNLEYADRGGGSCAAVSESNWLEVGQPASSTQWRGFAGSPTDGATLPQVLLQPSDASGTYEEANPSALNPVEVQTGDDVEYDWVVQNNNATSGATYCFRMVNEDGSPLAAYNNYPTVITGVYTPASQNWQWFDDENNETPTSPLDGAGENVAPANVSFDNTIKLRMTIRDTAGANGTDVKFRLQFSESSDFSGDVFNVEATSTCVDGGSLWCYGDGVDDDDDPISAPVLSDSTSTGVHNEVPTSTSSFDPQANTETEFEFTIRQAGARANTVYYFRAYDVTNDQPVNTNTGETYPSLSTEGAQLVFTIDGLPSGITVESVVTQATTTSTGVPFGSLPYNTSTIAAQRLTVSTNATEGYQIFLYQRQGLLRAGDVEIQPVSSTNEAPDTWSSACAGLSCYGYHTSDPTLSGGSTRFAVDNTYARFETSTKEIAFHPGPIDNDTTEMVYRVQVNDQQQPGGIYESAAVYIVTPIF